MDSLTDTLRQRIQNELDYNDRGTKHKIIHSEVVPHEIHYRDYPYYKLFCEIYCVVLFETAHSVHREYVQTTVDSDTGDLWIESIGRL